MAISSKYWARSVWSVGLGLYLEFWYQPTSQRLGTYLAPTDRAFDALHHFFTLFFEVVSETLARVTRLLGAWWLRVVPQDQPWIELTPIHYHTTFYSLLVPYYMDRGLTWRVA